MDAALRSNSRIIVIRRINEPPGAAGRFQRGAAWDIRDLDLNLLLVLDALFEEGTLTRAAQRLKLRQPTMERVALRQACGGVGDDLFVRGRASCTHCASDLPVLRCRAKTIRLDILSRRRSILPAKPAPLR